MQFKEKINQLTAIIENTLVPLIDNDFVLMELPYYNNIGDVLIWEGELQFIRKHLRKYSLLYACSMHTCTYPNLKKNAIILLQGGGNFGDLWFKPQEFRRKIIKRYPDNKIIILPQTVWYDNEECMHEDAALLSKHNNLTICARDKNSYLILKQCFTVNTVLLVPDMAFCIPVYKLKKNQVKQGKKNLFLRRNDKELNRTIDYLTNISEIDFDVHDWPSMEKIMISCFFMRCFLWASRRMMFLFSKLADIYASLVFKPNVIKTGVRFISKYENIYTTRLHVAILCCLLEKPCTFFDNSYGKNNSFYETWLSDLDGMKFIAGI
ncbi:MAG: polysaccharide pyruvyl transferase family protein [Treponema sp.]|jgi:pyruvyl transferase EpsO|nr:polysaccharide pyruvyl transferase family protein [Treponema sp.]